MITKLGNTYTYETLRSKPKRSITSEVAPGLLGIGTGYGLNKYVSPEIQRAASKSILENFDFKSDREARKFLEKLIKSNNIDASNLNAQFDLKGRGPLSYRGDVFSRVSQKDLKILLDQIPEGTDPHIIDAIKNKKNYINLNRNKAAIVHELGHATGNLPKDIGPIHPVLQGIGRKGLSRRAAVLAPIAGALGGAHDNDDLNAAGKAIAYGNLALASPMLVEEIRATGRGYSMLKNLEGSAAARKVVPTLGKAFGTYGVLAAAPVLALHAGQLVKGRINRDN